jgi:hypothetical protein
MAIDMIENNELSALAKSRLGDIKQFTDENQKFKNFSGNEDVFQRVDINEEFENLFGINIFGDETFKKNKENSRKEAEQFVAALPQGNCDNIQTALDRLALYIEAQTKELGMAKGHVTEYSKIKLEVARKAEADLKMKQSNLDCINIKAKAESEAKKAELIKTLTNVSEASVQQAKTDLFGTPAGQPLYAPATTNQGALSSVTTALGGSNKNLLIYGGIGVIVLILLLRRD